MQRFITILFLISGVFLLSGCGESTTGDSAENNGSSASGSRGDTGSVYVMAIHGGAGNLNEDRLPEETEQRYKSLLREARDIGFEVLAKGGSSVDAVVAAINFMENDSNFNAGKGSVLTSKGAVEMDASVMNGKTRNSGAVASVSVIKNPITAARMVMEKSKHVMFVSEGAEDFAREKGLRGMPRDYFYTWKRKRSFKKKDNKGSGGKNDGVPFAKKDKIMGTVGAVALDKKGNLAAGTSTGGTGNKKPGRVGDSPIIGAGNYANNKTCAVSATGHGEYFIRNVVAYDVSANMEYNGMSVKEAAEKVIHKKLVNLGGSGGIIVVDHKGNITMPYEAGGMLRSYRKSTGEKATLIFKAE